MRGPDSLRAQIGQLSWAIKDYREPRRLLLQLRTNRAIKLPRLPRRRRIPGCIWAVTMVKDEQDVIVQAVQHLLDQGIDHVLVADNLSTDDTPRLLADLTARDPRVHVARDTEPAYWQAEKMSRLARVAARSGADWVLPFDADEFWFAPGQTLAEFIRAQSAGTLYAELHHMVPETADPADLTAATFVMDATGSFPGKVMIRAHRLATLLPGNHGASRVGEVVDGLHIAHALFRGPGQVARKVRQGAAAVLLTDWEGNVGQHWRSGASLDDAAIEGIWDDLSHGRPVPVLGFLAAGPMVRVRALSWRTWDPDGEVPDPLPERKPGEGRRAGR